MFNAKIRKEIQTEQKRAPFFVRHNIEYEVNDCKIRVSFIFETVFLNIFVASSMFNIVTLHFSELALETCHLLRFCLCVVHESTLHCFVR